MRLVENAIIAGRFRLNHLMQRGGMGSVWHATHLGLDIPCALKFVKGELLENEDVVSRFEREAKAAAQLRGPNVVQILDHGVCEGTPYMAMELLDGEDLGARLRRVGRLTPEALHFIMNGVCRALSRAHSMGIVHRDIKPGNIFLVRDDEFEIPKVLDFGIAKTVRNELDGSNTKTGAMLGTPYYMSPEQAQGTRAVDFRSDLWSLAVICYQCLTGKLPFESEALGDLLVRIIVAPIPVPSQVAPVPPGFDKWWFKATQRDASERFQSAKEFSDTLAIVCGISHVSSVIDGSQLHIEKATHGATPPGVPGNPWASAPVAPAVPPDPNATGVAPPPTRPAPLPEAVGAAPLAHPVPIEAGAAPAPATPPPLSRSFVAEEPTVPIEKGGSLLAYIAMGLILFTVLLGVGWYAFHIRSRTVADQGQTPAATSEAQPSTSPTPTGTPPSTPAATPPAEPPPSSPAAPSPPAASGSPAPPADEPSPSTNAPASAPDTTKTQPGHSSPGTTKPSTNKTSKSKGPLDMGF
jgi:serine/threonine-protein kinase